MIMVRLKKMSNLSRVEISCVCVAAARGDVNIEMQRFGGWAWYNCTS
jgi:hypothetical protein